MTSASDIVGGAATLIDSAISDLDLAQQEIRRAQALCNVGDKMWHRLETLDDHIHNALSKLGI